MARPAQRERRAVAQHHIPDSPVHVDAHAIPFCRVRAVCPGAAPRSGRTVTTAGPAVLGGHLSAPAGKTSRVPSTLSGAVTGLWPTRIRVGRLAGR
jgi:hypothetical protein